MSEHISETTRFSIQLPSGELADTYYGSPRDAYLWTFPDDKRAYAWDDLTDAQEVFKTFADATEPFGLRAFFMERAAVVRVTVRTVHTMDVWPASEVADEPIVETEVVGVTVPRKFDRAEDVPKGVQVRAIGWPSASPTFIRNDELLWDEVGNTQSIDRDTDTDAYLNQVWNTAGAGFIEVLPDPAQPGPRTWAQAADIPMGVSVRPAGVSTAGFYWVRRLEGLGRYNAGGDYDGLDSLAQADRCNSGGFVEVLS